MTYLSSLGWSGFKERFGPITFAVSVLIAYVLVNKHLPATSKFEVRVEGIVGEVGSIAAVLVGFLATFAALMYALPDRPFVRRVAEMGTLTTLIKYIKNASFLGFATLGIGLLIQLSKGIAPSMLHSLFLGLWIFTASLAFGCFFRAAILIAKLLEYTMDSDE